MLISYSENYIKKGEELLKNLNDNKMIESFNTTKSQIKFINWRKKFLKGIINNERTK